jgi:chromosomal replication initiation ATPase DnaA
MNTDALLKQISRQLEVIIHRLPAPATSNSEAIDSVVKAAADEWQISHTAVIGNRRMRAFVEARTAAIGIIHAQHPSLSLNDIGYHLGGRDHSSVFYAIRNFHAWRESDPAFRNRTDALLKRLHIKLPIVGDDVRSRSSVAHTASI